MNMYRTQPKPFFEPPSSLLSKTFKNNIFQKPSHFVQIKIIEDFFQNNSKWRRRPRWWILKVKILKIFKGKTFSNISKVHFQKNLIFILKYVMIKKSKMAVESRNGVQWTIFTQKSTEMPPTR
jgi:hypothetical protein